jgi:3-oxoacyl-[acyl-carrier protein] reductase
MIVVTGASGGIGTEMLASLIDLDKVIGIYNSNLPKKDFNSKVIFSKVNLASVENINKFVQNNKKILKNITLIHCAVIKIDSPVFNFKETDWEKIIDVNIKANFFLTKALLPFMIKNNWGRIIHISSVAGYQGALGTIPYGLSKTALTGLSRGLAKEYAKFNITSNVIELGYFNCGLFNSLSDLVKKQLLSQIPSKKLGGIKNIINCIRFLIDSEYVNGSKINIDGGI